MSDKKPRESRAAYKHFLDIPTRWMDNDVYGHVNNVNYYSYFDTVINKYLIDAGGFDLHKAETVGVCAESACRFHEGIAYPEVIAAGLRAGHLGNRAVRYEVGLFREGGGLSAADGHFVHVWVDRASMAPIPIPDTIRSALAKLVVA